MIQARLATLSNLNFDDFLNSVVQDQYGLDFSQYAVRSEPFPESKPGDETIVGQMHPQKHRDNIMQNVIGHIYG